MVNSITFNTKVTEHPITFEFDYCSKDTVLLELTPPRYPKYNVTVYESEQELSDSQIQSMAMFYLKATLNQHQVSVEDVIFTPADTLNHCNTQGKPVYVFSYTKDGSYVYEFETHFSLKDIK